MAGIQYFTAWTDAAQCGCERRVPLHHGPSCQAGRTPDIPVPTPANLRSAATKHPPAGELPHMARAREALRHRCDAEEEPMSDLAARFAYSPLLSTAFKVVCLFCVLGLALSVAIVPMIAPEHLAWALSHIE